MAGLALHLQGSWDEEPVGGAPSRMTSLTPRPPGFVSCYVCQREFGSRSIEIHEPQCLDKWRANNAKLPKNRRARTPSPPPGHPLHGVEGGDNMSPTPAYTPTSDPDELSTSWPQQPPLRPQNGRPRSASFSEGMRRTRPSTATLKKPKIPVPCMTCGKEQNPERFHSHPAEVNKFTAKDDNTKEKTKGKLSVTKPLALKYKSKGEEEKRGRKSKLRPPARVKEKHRSSDVSPEPTKKPVPLKKFMKDQKASMAKSGSKDLTIEIFDADTLTPRGDASKPSQQSDKAPSPPRGMAKIEEGKESHFEAPSGKPSDAVVPPKVQRAPGTAPTLVCYICGREFGSRSLKIHQPQCLEKWRRENDRLPKHLQRAEPEAPTHELTQEQWNEFAWKTAQAQLVPCEWCGRTFFPERLEVHQRGCKPPPGAPAARKKSSSGQRPDTSSSYNLNASLSASKPTVVCYICGREFGSMSINIHEPQCIKKWRLQNEALPDDLKRPEPQKPELVYDESGNVDKEAMAEAAWKTHLETLVACKCGRTFFPDRLAKHQKSCTKA